MSHNFPHPEKHPVPYWLAMAATNAESLWILAKDSARTNENRANALEVFRDLAKDWEALSGLDTAAWEGLSTWRFLTSVVAVLANAQVDQLPWRTVWPGVAAKLRDCSPPPSDETLWMYNELKEHWQGLQGEIAPLPAVLPERAEESGRCQQKRRGRPADTDPRQDERIHDAWETATYRTYAELANELGKTKREVKLAIDRMRQRRNRSKS